MQVGFILLTFLQVPLQADLSKLKSECSVWDWTGDALDEGDFASEYLSDFMGHKGKMIRQVIAEALPAYTSFYVLAKQYSGYNTRN